MHGILQKPMPSAGTAPREEPRGTYLLGRSFSLIYSLFYLYVWSRTLGKQMLEGISQVTLFSQEGKASSRRSFYTSLGGPHLDKHQCLSQEDIGRS